MGFFHRVFFLKPYYRTPRQSYVRTLKAAERAKRYIIVARGILVCAQPSGWTTALKRWPPVSARATKSSTRTPKTPTTSFCPARAPTHGLTRCGRSLWRRTRWWCRRRGRRVSARAPSKPRTTRARRPRAAAATAPSAAASTTHPWQRRPRRCLHPAKSSRAPALAAGSAAECLAAGRSARGAAERRHRRPGQG